MMMFITYHDLGLITALNLIILLIGYEIMNYFNDKIFKINKDKYIKIITFGSIIFIFFLIKYAYDIYLLLRT